MRAIVSMTSPRTAGVGRLGEEHVDAAFGEHAHVLAAGERAFVDGAAVGVLGEGVGEDQRRERPGHAGSSRSPRPRRATVRRCVRGRSGSVMAARITAA